jgi:hypothetical protein
MDSAPLRRRLRTRTLGIERLESRNLLAAITWINSSGGSWHNPQNWDLGRIPAATDDVSIPDLSGEPIIRHEAGNTQIASLTSRETVQILGGSFRSATISQQERPLVLGGGQLRQSNLEIGSLVVAGTGSIIDRVHIAESASLTVSASASLTIRSHNGLTIGGQATVADSSRVILDASGSASSASILVLGSLAATGAQFSSLPASSVSTVIRVEAAGSIAASNSTFQTTRLAVSPTVPAGHVELRRNVIQSTVELPQAVLSQLAQQAAGDRNSYRDIELPEDQLLQNLHLMELGTGSQNNLRYLFPNGLTIPADRQLTIGENVYVVVPANQQLIVNGTLVLQPVAQLFLDSSKSAASTGLVVAGTLVSDNAILFAQVNAGSEASMLAGPNAALRLTNTTILGIDTSFDSNADIQIVADDGTFSDYPGNMVADNDLSLQRLIVANGSTATIRGSIALRQDALFSITENSVLTIDGSLRSPATSPSSFAALGRLVFQGQTGEGAPHSLELLSHDAGLHRDGFKPENFLFGAIEVGAGVTLRLVDDELNSPLGGTECLYVDTLIVRQNGILDVNNLSVYARSIFIDPTATVIGGDVPQLLADGGIIVPGRPTPGAIAQSGEEDTWQFEARQQSVANIEVIASALSRPTPAPPQINVVRVRLIAPNGETIAEASSGADRGTATILGVELPVDGIYRVVVSAPIEMPEATGNYIATIIDATENRRLPAIRIASNRPDDMRYGDPAIITVKVSPRTFTGPGVTGTVQIALDGVPLGPPRSLVAGSVTIQLPELSIGSHEITANYISDNDHFDDRGPEQFQQIVLKAILQVRADDQVKVAGQPIPDLTFEYSGFVRDEGPQVIRGSARLSVSPEALDQAGEYEISADITDLSADNYLFEAVSGILTVRPDAPADLTVVSGETQVARVLREFDQLVVVEIRDQYGNAIPNVPVVFTAPSSGPSLRFGLGNETVTVTTDSLGTATTPPMTANDRVGDYSVSVSTNLLTTSFSLANIPTGPELEFSSPFKSISERGGEIPLTLIRNTPLGEALTVTIDAGEQTRVEAPATVTFLPDAGEVEFVVRIIDNAVAEGTETITVQASSDTFQTLTEIQVVDDDIATLVLSSRVIQVREDGNPIELTLTRNTSVDVALEVRIDSSLPDQLRVPNTVVFPIGAKQLTFLATPINDTLFDGPQLVEIRATANTMVDGIVRLTVDDEDILFPWHNPADPFDVNGDERVNSLDALVIINYLNRNGGGVLGSIRKGPFVDTNADNEVHPIDALIIINQLNRQSSGEGEATEEIDMLGSHIEQLAWSQVVDEQRRRERRRR